MLETGTLFDLEDFDFSELMGKLFGKKDEAAAEDPALMVGERDIPDRDNRYVDKSFEDED